MVGARLGPGAGQREASIPGGRKREVAGKGRDWKTQPQPKSEPKAHLEPLPPFTQFTVRPQSPDPQLRGKCVWVTEKIFSPLNLWVLNLTEEQLVTS